jgi:hypothetical protein
MGHRKGNGGKGRTGRRKSDVIGAQGDRILDRLVRSLAVETSIPPSVIPEVIEDLLGLISSELEDVAPDPNVEIALSPRQLHEQLMEWGYRDSDLSEDDVDRILNRLIQEMSRISDGAPA